MSGYPLGPDEEHESFRARMAEADDELSWRAQVEASGEKGWGFPVARNLNEKDKNMANIKDVYGGGKGLKADDLKGRSHLLRISEVRLVKFDDGAKLVLSFDGREKELVCNKTNAQMIASKCGDDYDRWVGEELEVYPDKTQFNGALVDCIRVRFPIPAATQDEPIPF